MTDTTNTLDAPAAVTLLSLDDFRARTADLITRLTETVEQVTEHDHPKHEDVYCLNLVGYMGDRMGVVLDRLAAEVAEVDRLRAELEQARRKVCVTVTCEECSEAFRQDDITCHFTSLDEARSIVPDADWVFVGDQAYCGMCRHETHAFVASEDGATCQRCDLEEDDHQPAPAAAAEAVAR